MLDEYIERLLNIDLVNRDFALDENQSQIQVAIRKEVKLVLKQFLSANPERERVLFQAILNAFRDKMLGKYIKEILT